MAFKPFDLSGKVAIVTGGNSGIGLGMAEGLAQAGADVAIWGTNPDKNAKAEDQLKSYGTKILSQIVDVTDETRVNEATVEVVNELGRIDTCIANAGRGKNTGPFDTMESETWRDVLALNLDGVFYTLRASAHHMVERSKNGDAGGSLVGMSSMLAIRGFPTSENYGAAKGGIISMMKHIAVEYGRHNIRANSLLPGYIDTGLVEDLLESDYFENNLRKRIPVRRWGKPEDLAGIAVYLASDASQYHTGQEFIICGGLTVNGA